MKAVICTAYGPPEMLQLQEVSKPIPGDHDVLVRVHATAVTASDCIVRGFKLPPWHPLGFLMGIVVGFSRPRNAILGMIVAGEVERVGSAVSRFAAGDQIYGMTGTRFGCYASYICLPEVSRARYPGDIPSAMAPKPSNMNDEEAAAVVYGAGMALYYLEKAAVQPGHHVLIYGASGAIGTSAVQLAKHHFQASVTGVCSGANAELIRSLGADHVIDYTRQDSLDAEQHYDFVLDAVGKKKTSPLKLACQQALLPNGRYLSVDNGNPVLQVSHLVLLRELIEAGKFKAVIDRCYPLERIVEAHRYVDQGHKKGNVVITVADE
jgi:NADPH:quinone reductase-like Zn-dependent oxidoreductase